ncbi:pentapeptide repeat-containing protein [Halorubrum sp. CBA1229]|uniref:pentapeptide repeat-containing protein n=1 Tax=Halorubrum sp. CBA1229 TaxID=1853699 RepID=UPI000F3F3722|nr:pentapeptide repeat-containing protein [Halorubrum sp. CBA1229]QKY17830.1 pentapeptide repeat-containing protein [Halorubrum sp. CBA1229]
MTETEDRCGYVHEDADAAPAGWECPHPADGDERCVFHRPAGDGGADRVAAAFEAAVAAGESDPRRRRFYGATIERLALPPGTLLAGDRSHAVDLADATVGEIAVDGATVGSDLRLDGATVAGDFDAKGLTCFGDLRCQGLSAASVDLRKATVDGAADFAFATVDGSFSVTRAELGRLALSDAEVGGTVNANLVRVDERTEVNSAAVEGSVLAADATFDGEVRAMGTSVGGALAFTDSAFGDGFNGNDASADHGMRVGGPTVFKGVAVDGATDFRYATFEGPVQFHPEQHSTETRFDGAVDFEQATFEAGFDLREVVFDGRLYLADATVSGTGRLDGAELDRGATLDRTETSAAVSAASARIGGQLSMADCEFGGAVAFDGAVVAGEIDCNGGTRDGATRFGSGLSLADAECRSGVDLRWVESEERISFHDPETAGRTTFGDTVDATGARLDDGLDARAARFDHLAGFEAVRAGGDVRLDGCEIGRLRSDVSPADDGDRPTVTAHGASVSEGRIAHPGDGTVTYDFADARIGRVRIEAGDGPIAPLAAVRFLGTSFDGFRFGPHHGALEAISWRLHDTETDADLPEPDPGPRRLETTYQQAKTGANGVGDATAAAEFFRREMRHRRAGHAADVRSERGADRAVAAYDWLANAVLDATAGYGERPSWTMLSSVVVVLAFAGGYAALGVPADSAGELLLFSFQSFITFVIGPAPAESFSVRLLSSAQGFLGAFLVALFVFALTRSVDR